MSQPVELSKAYEPSEVEPRISAFWVERALFRPELPTKRPPFCIVLPPPNVTGSLHIGHALTATIEDILVRWKRMSGFNTLWVPGIDHAGIATQVVVEREIKKTEGKSRHELGREAFIERVWKWKEKYGSRIGEQHRKLGASLDWSRERFTMDEGLVRAVREVFVQLYEAKLIYRAARLINWCPSCLTALSDLEVEHEEKKGSLWHIRYPVDGQPGRHLVVATTRPETMLGDTAVAVHPDDPRYKDLIGKHLVLPLLGRRIPVIADAVLVNPEFGTGAVKVTPAHDFNDYETGLRHKLPMISIFDESARLNGEAGTYQGLERFEARKRVLADLQEAGLLEKEEPHALSIGTCQRCSTVVEPRLSPQWWVKATELAKPAIEAVEQGRTRFVPESWTNTYFHWMRNIHDWCVSRQLWWGHQIPAYYCNACSPRLGDDADLPLDAPTITKRGGIDFSKAEPFVAREPPERCSRCGARSGFTQDPDVLDTWFSSGLWPFATLGWPEKTKELETFYPNSVMETGHDILFFWVARMMMFGLHFMKDVPFQVVYLHAMVRDDKGEKMSKVKGNVIDPLDVIEGAKPEALPPALRNKFPQGMPAHGADALRFTLAASTQAGRDIKLSLERVAGYRGFANKLWNASRFVLMHLGDWKKSDATFTKGAPLSLADRWILSRLERATVETLRALEAYEFSDAASTLYQFVWRELCDWYIELAKGPLTGDDAEARKATQGVLVFVLEQVLRLLHPFMPHVTEEIWHKLPISHTAIALAVARYPGRNDRLVDVEAEAEMAPVIAAIEGLRNIRGESNLSPALKLEAEAQVADPKLRASLEKWRHYVLPLAGLKSLRIGPPAKKPPKSAAHVGEGLELFVPLAGLIDFDEERARLSKELARVEQESASIKKKMENPNFVARAPADLVARDRARIDELAARTQKLLENLERLAEAPMPETPKPPVSSRVPREGETVDLAKELKGELAEVQMPTAPDASVDDALKKLREETKDLSSSDHYQLGVAYIGMGLVDEAVREFNKARKPAAKAKTSGKKKSPRRAAAAKAKRKAPGRKKKPVARKKRPAAKKAKSKAKGRPKSRARPKKRR